MNYSKLHKAVENSKLTIDELCKKIHISRKTFYNNLENQNLKVETLEKICATLKLPITYFFENETELNVIKEPEAVYNNAKYNECQKELLNALKELNEVRKEHNLLLIKLNKNK